MIISTTTNTIEGKEIIEYKGIVFGEVMEGINFLKDISAGFRNFLGGRSKAYEEEIVNGREMAMREMEERAAALGANAVIGVKFDYETFGTEGGMVLITCSGTAVVTR